MLNLNKISMDIIKKYRSVYCGILVLVFKGMQMFVGNIKIFDDLR